MPRQYYFDYAATTPLNPKVLKAMAPYFSKNFGNPSSLYKLGRESAEAIRKSSGAIAKILSCQPDEFIFTGSATEADNLAIFGIARANKENNCILVSQIEHKGILAACDKLEKEGFEIIRLPVLKNGLIDLEFLKKSLNEKTSLVSVTMADSETGTIQPIFEISKIIKNFREKSGKNLPYFHTDATQAAVCLDINVKKLGVDLMTLSAHKIYGPKGIGGIFVKKDTRIDPIIVGGGQGPLRSGTENIPGIVGFAESLKLNQKNKKEDAARVKKMRDLLEKGIFKSIPKVVFNGNKKKRLPNFLNISFLDIEGEALLLHLDQLGIMASTGSACNSLSLEPSYILSATGNPYEYIHGSLRFSLGIGNTVQDIKYVLKHLPEAVKRLRDISPLNLSLNQKQAISNPKAFIGGQTPHFLRKK